MDLFRSYEIKYDQGGTLCPLTRSEIGLRVLISNLQMIFRNLFKINPFWQIWAKNKKMAVGAKILYAAYGDDFESGNSFSKFG